MGTLGFMESLVLAIVASLSLALTVAPIVLLVLLWLKVSRIEKVLGITAKEQGQAEPLANVPEGR